MVDLKDGIKRVLDFSPTLGFLLSGEKFADLWSRRDSNQGQVCTRGQSGGGDIWLARSTEHLTGRIYLNRRFYLRHLVKQDAHLEIL